MENESINPIEEVLPVEVTLEDGTVAPLVKKPTEATEVSDEVLDEVLEAEIAPESSVEQEVA